MEDLPAPVIEFAETNRLNGYFVNEVILTAAELKKECGSESAIFSSLVLSRISRRQKEFITGAVSQMMDNNKDLAEEYNMPATESDFLRMPLHIRSRFPTDTTGWQVKDIEINTRWIMYFDQVTQSEPLFKTVDKILKIFRPQIYQLSND